MENKLIDFIISNLKPYKDKIVNTFLYKELISYYAVSINFDNDDLFLLINDEDRMIFTNNELLDKYLGYSFNYNEAKNKNDNVYFYSKSSNIQKSNYTICLISENENIKAETLLENYSTKINKYINKNYRSAYIHNLIINGLDSIDKEITIIDKNGDLVFANKTLKDIHNTPYNVAKLNYGENIDDLITNSLLSRVLRTGVQYENFSYIATSTYDGRPMEYLTSAYPIYDEDNNIIGAIDIFKSNLLDNKGEDANKSSEMYEFHKILGDSPEIRETINMAKLFAGYNENILINGESGTGKELFAQSIHSFSNRKNFPFVAINCANLPDNLIDSELFGYESGAFTGANKGGKLGKFELANNGTIFLDEIGDLPLHLQAKLLRVIETKTVTRLGSNENISVDVRFIFATNVDLESFVKEKNFRGDLYYRLKVFHLSLPPLRNRGNDIVLLAQSFIDKNKKLYNRKINGLTEEAKKQLLKYDWPGNIRELENLISRAFVLSDTPLISKECIIKSGLNFSNKKNNTIDYSILENKEVTIEDVLKAIEETNGNKKKAAQILGISRSKIYRIINNHKNN